MRPIQVILTLEDLRKHSASSLTRKGTDLSQNDTNTALDVYQQWLLLMYDVGYLTPSTLKKTGTRLFGNLAISDVLTVNNAFSELAALIKVQSNRGFKVLCNSISTHLYTLLREDVSRMVEGDVLAAGRLLQITSYTSRLTLTDIDLTQECLTDYMATEHRFDDWLPGRHIQALNRIIQRWMTSFDSSSVFPNHGPGGVAGHGRTSLEVKYKDLTDDALLRYAFPTIEPMEGTVKSTFDRISHTIFVPKSYKTFRTISMEPSTLQYYQQGVWKEIDRVVSSSHFLRNRIGFHEQTRNQLLAQEGSINRNYATIDLSAASDSVSYLLVKKLFRGTKLLRFLVATRSSRSLLPDGNLVALKKFAPMGSALCFPIETIIFAAICQYVTVEHGVSGDFSVFGDDIIVPTQCVDDVNYLLSVLGFLVNTEKSFTDPECWYRESCGAEFCDGYDVTPLRVSRNYTSVDQLTRFESLVSVANECDRKCFPTLRLFFIQKILEANSEMLFSPTGLVSANYTNFHTRRRWNPNLQYIECHVMTLGTKQDEGTDQEIRLRHWLETTHQREILGDGFQSNTGRATVRQIRRWMMKPYEQPDQLFIDYFKPRGENLPLL